MGIKFDDSVINNYGHPQTVEESFRVYGNWASIHDFNFESDLEEEEVILSRIAINSWQNYTIIQKTVPSDILLEFDIPSPYEANDGFAVIVAWNKAQAEGYAIGFEGNNAFLARYNGSAMTTLSSRPAPFSLTNGHFKIAVRQQFYSSEQSDLWLSFSVWLNDALVDTWTIYTGAPLIYSSQLGFAYYGTTSEFLIENVRVPQLSSFVDWNSLDPGEPPLGGLQRSIEGRYLKFHIRHNGALRGWRSKPTSLVRAFDPSEEIYVTSIKKDKRKLYNHVRILGAYVEAEYISAPLLMRGHRFTEINNPFLMTVADCYAEAKNQVRMMMEAAYVESLSSPFTPLLSIEDRIETPDGGRIVNSRSWNFSPGEVEQEMEARLYGFIEGEKVYYVDGINGNSSNTGTRLSPYKFLSDLPVLGEGDTIFLARGSTFKEGFKPNVNKISLLAYGSGASPIFDCADVVSMTGAILEAGTTNVYKKSFTSPNASSTSWHSVFENGLRLKRVSSIAACEAAAGTYYLASDNTSSPEVFIHASDNSNVATNGKTYTISTRDGIDFSQSANSIVKGIEVRYSRSSLGGIRLSNGGQADSVVILESSLHAISLDEETSLRNFTITGLHAEADEASAIYCNDEDALGLDILIENGTINEGQIKLAGLAAIGSKTVSGNVMGTITLSDVTIVGCEFLNRSTHYSKLAFKNVNYSGLVNGTRIGKGVRVMTSAEIELVDCTLGNVLNFAYSEAVGNLSFQGCSLNFAGNMSNAGIFISHDIILSVENSSFPKSGAGTNQHAISAAGSISIDVGLLTNSFFGDGRLWTFPVDVDAAIHSFDNCLVADREFEANGIFYANLAAVQADGYEDSTLIGGC